MLLDAAVYVETSHLLCMARHAYALKNATSVTTKPDMPSYMCASPTLAFYRARMQQEYSYVVCNAMQRVDSRPYQHWLHHIGLNTADPFAAVDLSVVCNVAVD